MRGILFKESFNSGNTIDLFGNFVFCFPNNTSILFELVKDLTVELIAVLKSSSCSFFFSTLERDID